MTHTSPPQHDTLLTTKNALKRSNVCSAHDLFFVDSPTLTGVCWAPVSLTGVRRQQVPFPGTRGPRTPGFPFPARPPGPLPGGKAWAVLAVPLPATRGSTGLIPLTVTRKGGWLKPRGRNTLLILKKKPHMLLCIIGSFLQHLENNEIHK